MAKFQLGNKAGKKAQKGNKLAAKPKSQHTNHVMTLRLYDWDYDNLVWLIDNGYAANAQKVVRQALAEARKRKGKINEYGNYGP